LEGVAGLWFCCGILVQELEDEDVPYWVGLLGNEAEGLSIKDAAQFEQL
jgi:hypothetical protein